MRRRLTLWIPLLLLLGSTACGEPAVEVDPGRATIREERNDSGPLVVFLGDSLSAGLGLTGTPPFPDRTAELLRERGVGARIVNAGVSGDTTAGGLERLPWLLQQKPDIVVVELGANDGLRGLPHRVTRDNLERIIRAARDGGAEVLLLGMQIPPSYGRAYAEGFAALYGEVSRELDVALVDDFLAGVGGRATMTLADGLHPNDAGHQRLAENVVPALQTLIEDHR
jgi:acyl-CoA thioesterase-1